MKLSLCVLALYSQSILAHESLREATVSPFRRALTVTPAGCRVKVGDQDWPSKEVWSQELAGAVPRPAPKNSQQHPDYRLTARNAADVQRAVKFASAHNVRLSIINTGHDYLGRNDAPSGLWLDVSRLQGVRVSPDFMATPEGMPSPQATVNVIPAQNATAAVTFGVGVNTATLNKAIKASKLFTMGAAHGSVSVAGGWGQMAGHAPLSNQYGLGVDQFLEFKVVTPDGQLRVANKVSNSDLFWALRGGGGGTFGIVTEATIKAYPHVPITAYAWWLNSTTAGIPSTIGSYIGMGSGMEGMYDALEILGKAMPTISDQASSAYIYAYPWGLRGFGITVGENATSEYANKVWTPVLGQMKTKKNMKEPQIKMLHFDNYQDFYDYTYETGMTTGCYKMQTLSSKTRRHGPSEAAGAGAGCACKRMASQRNRANTPLMPRAVCSGLKKRHGPGAADESKPMAYPSCSCKTGLTKRHGPGASNAEMPAIAPEPITPGIVNLDSVLLGTRHFQSPNFRQALRENPVGFGWLLVSGNKAHRPDDDTSVNPAWRTAQVHAMGIRQWPVISMKNWQTLAQDSGTYGNEASYQTENWKQAFWGSNYARLSQIKTKYDPNMLLWVSPGINADLMEATGGRVCAVNSTQATAYTRFGAAPRSDNTNFASLLTDAEALFGETEAWGGFPAKDFTKADAKVKPFEV